MREDLRNAERRARSDAAVQQEAEAARGREGAKVRIKM
jgi:hypothetical protein